MLDSDDSNSSVWELVPLSVSSLSSCESHQEYDCFFQKHFFLKILLYKLIYSVFISVISGNQLADLIYRCYKKSNRVPIIILIIIFISSNDAAAKLYLLI